MLKRVVATMAAVAAIGAAGCVPDNVLPDDTNWREDLAQAISNTEGVSVGEPITVPNVDGGFNRSEGSPSIRGGIIIDHENPQEVIDAMVSNICDVLGPDTFGIGWSVFMRINGERGGMSDYGYSQSASDYCDEMK